MTSNSSSEIDALQQAISALESQREVLGDALVDTAVGPLREKLAMLEGTAAPAPPAWSQMSAEQRKLVTVLFADLVGFTALSENLDPEDVRDITTAYFSRWTAVIDKYGGTVEKYIGDAVMAVFGLAAAGENDPENAIQSALAMRDGLKALNQEIPQLLAPRGAAIQLRLRVGIHTGLVVVSWLGERKGQDVVVVGDTVNLASRLQALAPVNGILISHDTYRHVRGLFDVQVVEPVMVKGKRDPVQTYVVLQAKPHIFRRKLEGIEGVEIPLIGRDAELASLKTAFQQAVALRDYHLVHILGEAGIGKSRLLLEFDNWLETSTDYYYFHGRGSPAYQNVPMGLLRDLLANRFGIQDSDSPEILSAKLVRGITEAYARPTMDRLSTSRTEAASIEKEAAHEEEAAQIEMKAHFIGRLAGFGFGESKHLAVVEPRHALELGLAYLSEYLTLIASAGPLVLLLEDLHWADDSSLDLLAHLQISLANLPVLVVGTARPVLLERWPVLPAGQPNPLILTLKPLPPEQSQLQVESILQKVQDLPGALVELIVRSAEGNPFYAEELIKMLIEDGVLTTGEDAWQVAPRRLAGLKVPSTLTEVLQARFDSLSVPEKALLQKAAVIGRTFWDQALAFMLAQEVTPASSLQRGTQDENDLLERLSRRELVYSSGESIFEDTREFLFKHALLRDVTYASLLKSHRRIYHSYAARWLEATSGRSQRTEEFAALIADHYHQAGDFNSAESWFFRAASQAQARFANREALYLYEQALSLTTDDQPLTRADILLGQVEIQGLLGQRDEQRLLFTHLAEQLARISDPLQAGKRQAKAAYLRSLFSMQTSDYSACIELARQAVALARDFSELALEARAQSLWAGAYRYLANFSQAWKHYELTLALGQQAGLINLQADAYLGLGVVCEIQAEYTQARIFLEQALDFYRQSYDRPGESRVLNSLGVVETNLGEVDRAIVHLEAAWQLKQLIGDRFGQGVTLCNLGVVFERRYDFEAAIQYFRQSLQISDEIADDEGREAALIGIGNNQLAVGQYQPARLTLDAALVISRQIEDLQGEADILTSLGQIYIETGEIEAGLTLLRQVIEITEKIAAPSEMAYAWFYLGLGLEQLAVFGGAKAAYQCCLDLRRDLGQQSQAVDAICGLARVAGLQGESGAANDFAVQALETPGWEYGLSEPVLAYLTCYRALISTNRPLAVKTITDGYRFLQRVASQVRNAETRSSYLNHVAVNRELIHESAILGDLDYSG